MSPYPIDTPLDFNRDTPTEGIADAHGSEPCPNGLDEPFRFDTESLARPTWPVRSGDSRASNPVVRSRRLRVGRSPQEGESGRGREGPFPVHSTLCH